MPQTITSDNFDSLVLTGECPILLDFWAPWCVPCNLIKGSVEKAAKELEPDVRVGLVNIDEQPDLVAFFGVRGTPTFVLVNKGEVIHSFSGMAFSRKLVEEVRRRLATRSV